MSKTLSEPTDGNPPNTSGLTILAFIMVALLGGGNVVAVRFSNFGLPPFWGAAFRFASAALVFWMIVLLGRIKVPRGRALAGALILGTLTIGVSYAFLYWGLVYVSASMSVLILSTTPLMTFFFALAHGQEKFRWQGLVGALVALSGILIVIGNDIGGSLALLPVLALLAGVAAISEGNVIYKSYPKADPFAVNAVALSIGVPILLVISLLAGEAWILPTTAATWIAYAYLVLGGSVLLFYLYLYVLARWPASSTTYVFLLMPVSTIVLAAIFTDEQITPRFMLGSVVALLGVWLGAVLTPKAKPVQQAESMTSDEGV